MKPPVIPENEKLTIEEFHIGFEYMLWSNSGERYLPEGWKWFKLKYDFHAPRLHKMQKCIEEGIVKRVSEKVIGLCKCCGKNPADICAECSSEIEHNAAAAVRGDY